MSREDYAELPLYFEDAPEDYRPTVEAHLRDGSTVVCHQATSNPIRHQGYWTINHLRWPKEASTMIPADDLAYWVVLSDAVKKDGETPDGQQAQE